MQQDTLETALAKAIKSNNVKKVNYIIGLLCDVNKVMVDGKSVLVWAMEQKNEEIIEKLKAMGAKYEILSAKQRDELGRNLYNAIYNNKGIEEITNLIYAGANVEYRYDSTDILMLASSKGREDVVEKLLPFIKDINDWDCNGRTALFDAVASGNVEVVKILIDAGANISHKTNEGASIIGEATKREMIELLIENGADINGVDRYGYSLLKRAIDKKDEEFIKYLIEKKVKIDSFDYNGYSLVYHAIIKDMPSVALELIDKLGDINASYTRDGNSALMIAASYGDVSLVRELINRGADVNFKNERGETALMEAGETGNIDIIRLLIDSGANVNEKSKQNFTALHKALSYRKIEAVDFLLANGAKYERNEDERLDYLKLAVCYGDENTVRSILAFEKDKQVIQNALEYAVCKNIKKGVVTALVENGADINAKNEDGLTPILLRIQKGWCDEDIAREMIGLGADLKAKDNQGNTVLHMGPSGLVSFLVENGVDINAKNDKGRTPLMIAIINTKYDSISELIRCGADINVRDNEGHKAVHYVKRLPYTQEYFLTEVKKYREAKRREVREKMKKDVKSFLGFE